MKLKQTLHFGWIIAFISIILNSFRFFDFELTAIDHILNGFARAFVSDILKVIALSALFWFIVGFFFAFIFIADKKSIVKDVTKSLDKYLKPQKKEESKDLDIKICPECKAEINITDEKCPECGAEQFEDDLTEDD